MKRKLIITVLLLLCIIFCVASCSDDGVPAGMKLASDTSLVEYSLFVPSEWVIDSSTDRITSAHASKNDLTSVNLQKQAFDSLDNWWTTYKKSLSSMFKDLNILSENEDIVIGGLNAKKHIFTASFGEGSYFKYELIGVLKGNSAYVFTFTYTGVKNNDTITYSDEKHKDNIKKITDNFKFNDSLTEGEGVSFEVENTPEGMKCASDTEIVDYCLFVPNSWTIEKTGGTISSAYVSESDKTNINVMQWNINSYDFDLWWNKYKLQLFNAFDASKIPLNDKGEVITGEKESVEFLKSEILIFKEEGKDFKLGENDAKKYTYSVKMGDNVYDYEVFFTMHRASLYIMTFTFKSGCDMSIYQADIDKITSNFRFN